MKSIAYAFPDGTIILLSVAPDARRQIVVTPISFLAVETAETETSAKRFDCDVVPAETRPETDEELLARIADKDVPFGLDYKLVDNPLPLTLVNPEDEGPALQAWFASAGAIVGQGSGHVPGANSDREAPYQPSAYEIAESARLEAEGVAQAASHQTFLDDLTQTNAAEHEAWQARMEAARLETLNAVAEAEAAAAEAENAENEDTPAS